MKNEASVKSWFVYVVSEEWKKKWGEEGRKKKEGKKGESVKKRKNRNVCLIIDVSVCWNPSTEFWLIKVKFYRILVL